MGKLLMTNYNRELKPLLPEQLKTQISKAMRKKKKPEGMEDVDRMLDLRPSISKMTGGALIMELQLTGNDNLANSLLSWLMIYEATQRKYNMT